MNTIESCSVLSPYNKTEECAKFVIDELSKPYILSDIMTVGRNYTISLWIKSDAVGSISVAGSKISSSIEWAQHKITVKSVTPNLYIYFQSAGTYYIYHPQLEIGNKQTDYTPAPEDMATADDLNSSNDRIADLETSVASLSIKEGEIEGIVTKTTRDISDLSTYMANEIASMKLSSDQFKVEIQNTVNNGVSRVDTGTGFTFDLHGMMVDASDSVTKTQVTVDGMTVYKKDTAGDPTEVLKATSTGVDATNLHAKTYLIIGGRSRFENYDSNRTGCFWIGG